MGAAVLILSMLVYCTIIVSSNLIVYPVPQGVNASPKFKVFLSQGRHKQVSFTYYSSSDHRTKDADHVKGGRSVSWTSFGFTGGFVTVEIHTPNDFKNCLVRPKSYGYHCKRINAKTAVVIVTQSSKMMSVEFDYDYGSPNGGPDIKDKMLVFADPPESHVPNEHDTSVLYYKAGYHNLNGQLLLKSNIKTVYLAPGAFVEGGFITTANHGVTIRGRGVLSTGSYIWHDHRFKWAMINTDKGNHHVIEGITLVDPMQFFIRSLSDHNTVRNVKMLAPWTYNSDGIGIGHDAVIEDCFIWANDDSFKLYTDKNNITRCVVWQGQNGAVFQLGWWKGRDMQHVQVSDIDVIHTDWCTFKGSKCHLSNNDAVFDLGGNTENFKVSDINLRNIRIEGSCPRLVNFKMADNAVGSVSKIHFENWSVESQPTHDNLHNEITGSSHASESNWIFTNLKVGGHCISNPTKGDFKIGKNANNISFICK